VGQGISKERGRIAKDNLKIAERHGTYKDPAKAQAMLALISRWTSVPAAAIAQSLAYIDSRLDVGSVYEMVDWYRGQRMIEKGTDPKVTAQCG
jgi:hypothetical protein